MGSSKVSCARRRNLGVLAAVALAALGSLPTGWPHMDALAQTVARQSGVPIVSRHMGTSREQAVRYPRSEGDQAIVDGWPYYRTERGQAAFNDAMATLRATDIGAPAASAFKGCASLQCALTLPAIGADGWIPAGRIWVSPTEYVVVAHSPRLRTGQSYRRRTARGMRYFVFHEFHNSSRNTDLYDTISSHRSSVFVPFYMGKAQSDARGRRFVMVVQVAPYDVQSIHASNLGNAGSGIEVARNASDAVEPLQNTAGLLVASMVKAKAPHLRVVNHRGNEGLPMLRAYEQRLQALRAGSAAVSLPFTPAAAERLASVTGRLDEAITRPGQSARIPVPQRGIVSPQIVLAPASTPTHSLEAPSNTAPAPRLVQGPTLVQRPTLVEPVRPAAAPAVSR